MGHDVFLPAINPMYSMYDGDTLFAAGTGEVLAPDLNVLGIAAAEALQVTIYRALSEATSLDGAPSRKTLSSLLLFNMLFFQSFQNISFSFFAFLKAEFLQYSFSFKSLLFNKMRVITKKI